MVQVSSGETGFCKGSMELDRARLTPPIRLLPGCCCWYRRSARDGARCVAFFFSSRTSLKSFYEIEDYLTVQVCLHRILNKWSILQLACSTKFVPKMHYKSLKYMILLKSIQSPSNDEDELVGCAHSAYPFSGLGLELILILLFNVGI